MQKSLFPGYTIGVDAYDDIKNVCPAYGKKVAVIGGKHALAAAKEGILKGAADAGIEVIGVFWYGGEASVENMDMLRTQIEEADMIFAVGGGKAIDTVKSWHIQRIVRFLHSQQLLQPVLPVQALALCIIRTAV